MPTPVLETRDLTIRFGGHVAVDAVSAAFAKGQLTAIVGPNGAGKTTYFNLISGQLAATSGSVHLGPRDITRLGPAARTALGIGRAFQITNLFPNLTVRENVRLAVQARSRGAGNLLSTWDSRRDWIESADAVLESVALADRSAMLATGLSHGDKRKLEVAVMMALEPTVFMFDEPTAGMSVDESPVILDLIAGIKASGDKTILLVEHKMDVVRRLADRIIVLHHGRMVADGEPEAVIALPVVQEAYLGQTAGATRTTAAKPRTGTASDSAAPLLTLEGVHTHIGQYHILHGVDLAVPAGGVTVLLGRNGAGKTTTLRTIMGLLKPSQGQIVFDGRDLATMATPDIATAGIAYVPESMAVFADLTVAENMMLAARQGAPDAARLDWIFGFFPALKTFWRHPAGVLSGGQKQMLAVARAVIEPRRLILVDEPTKGLAPSIIDNMMRAFNELAGEGATILLVEQNVHFASTLGDTAAVMDDGRIVHAGPMTEFVADQAMQQRLLGLSLGA